MTNVGKFVDRSPIICAAGKASEPKETVASCLKNYPVDDAVTALKHDAGIYTEKERIVYKQQRMPNFRNRGIYTEIRPVMQPPVRTRYQTLINDLKETTYESYWTKLDGRSKDPTPNLPAGMDPLGVTFGKSTRSEVTVKELINPPKTMNEVLWNSQIGHELYKKTHNDYNPNERIDRNYLKPAYNPDKKYGHTTKYDPRGIWVKCACNWHMREPIYTTTERTADFLETHDAKLGKCLEPNKNIECVPKGHTFGKKSDKPMFGMKELLCESQPCLFKRDFLNWMAHLNHLRVYVKKRKHFGFQFEDLYNRLLYYDKELTGWICLDVLYEVCESFNIILDRKLMEELFNFLSYTDRGCIFYRAFLDLIDLNKPMPNILKIKDIPEENLYLITTNRAAACDHVMIDNSDMKPAGLPTVRHDLPYPVLNEDGCRADLENLSFESTAGQLIYPNIFTNYGLSHRDFFKPRSAEEIKHFFENIGYEFPEDVFEKLWNVALEHDKTGAVCLDTFKKLLRQNFPPLIPIKEGDKKEELKKLQ